MNCVNMKIKLDHTLYCKKYNKQIKLSDCKNCKLIEYAIKEQTKLKHIPVKSGQYPVKSGLRSNKPIKQRTSKQAKLEKDRFSIFTNNTELCLICQHNKKDHMHEVFCGCRRQVSMKWGICIPICKTCHREFQNDVNFNDYWHVKGQKAFMEYYNKSADEFREIFGRNYLDNDK